MSNQGWGYVVKRAGQAIAKNLQSNKVTRAFRFERKVLERLEWICDDVNELIDREEDCITAEDLINDVLRDFIQEYYGTQAEKIARKVAYRSLK